MGSVRWKTMDRTDAGCYCQLPRAKSHGKYQPSKWKDPHLCRPNKMNNLPTNAMWKAQFLGEAEKTPGHGLWAALPMGTAPMPTFWLLFVAMASSVSGLVSKEMHPSSSQLWHSPAPSPLSSHLR